MLASARTGVPEPPGVSARSCLCVCMCVKRTRSELRWRYARVPWSPCARHGDPIYVDRSPAGMGLPTCGPLVASPGRPRAEAPQAVQLEGLGVLRSASAAHSGRPSYGLRRSQSTPKPWPVPRHARPVRGRAASASQPARFRRLASEVGISTACSVRPANCSLDTTRRTSRVQGFHYSKGVHAWWRGRPLYRF